MLQHIIALSRTAVIVRHWFEIDLDDSSMEHGVRIEMRELASRARRGSESAAQLVTLDKPLWRADMFDRLWDRPGTFTVAHFHPEFRGNEPCPRVWDQQLNAEPWQWLQAQFEQLGGVEGRSPWALDPGDATALRCLSPAIVAIARQFAPDQCTSSAQCFELTNDARDAVQLMLASLQRPDLLDEDWVKPWRASA